MNARYSFNPATPPADLPELCTRCDAEINGEGLVRDCEKDAPYVAAVYCTVECRDAANEDAYDSEMTNRVERQ